MQLSRLRVKNIRSYESADVTFGGGTTLIAGDVGAGKTSLLYAIEMALFGVAEVNAAYLVRHGAGHAEVAVAFEGEDHRYEIARRFRRLRRKGQETFEAERIRFTVDGAETSYSATELRQRVIDLLGFPDNPSPQAHSDLWRWAVYVPQERMRDILGARPQERLETVRKALGVERYRIAADNAQDLAADLRRSAASRRAEADRLRHFDDEFLEGTRLSDRLRSDRAAAERSLSENRASVSSLETSRTEAEEKVRLAAADERERESLERERSTDQRTLEGLRRTVDERAREAARRQVERMATEADVQAAEKRRAALAEAEQELAAARRALEQTAEGLRALSEARALLASSERREADAQGTLERVVGEEQEARKALDEAEAAGPAKEPPAPVPESLTELDTSLSRARAKEAERLQELGHAESALAEVEELLHGGVCPRCGQVVHPSEFKAHQAEAAASARRARDELGSAVSERARIEERRKARERYERAHDRWNEVEKRRATARAAFDRAARSAQSAARELELARSAVHAARDELTRRAPLEAQAAESQETVVRRDRTRSDRSKDVERSLLALERQKGIDRALEALRSDLDEAKQEVHRVEQRLEERSRRIETLRRAHADLNSLRTAAAEANRRLAMVREQEAEGRATLARVEAQLGDANRRTHDAEVGRGERSSLLAEAKDRDEKAAWVGVAFRTALLEMEQKLLTHAQALFEREFARSFASLVDDPALVARTDPAFTPLVMIEGEWTPAEALSGGERTSLALAFRLALAHVVRSMGSLRLDTILLDEPTDGFSPEQVIRMGELLEELALPQVILVSHESQLAAISDRVIRVQKLDGRSTVEPGPRTQRESEDRVASVALRAS